MTEDSRLSAFFVSPSGDVQQTLLGVIQDAVGQVLRVDPWYDNAESGEVTRNVARSIHEAEVVFADVTDSNPNVYYEIGLAHCFGVPVVAFRQKGTTRPAFDLQGINYIEYEPDSSPGQVKNSGSLRNRIKTRVETILEQKREGKLQPTPVADLISARRIELPSQEALVVAVDQAKGSDVRDGMWAVHPELGYGKLELLEEDEEGNPRRFRVHFKQLTRVVRVGSDGGLDFDLYLPPRQRPGNR